LSLADSGERRRRCARQRPAREKFLGEANVIINEQHLRNLETISDANQWAVKQLQADVEDLKKRVTELERKMEKQ
jgi:hypothetical protein